MSPKCQLVAQAATNGITGLEWAGMRPNRDKFPFDPRCQLNGVRILCPKCGLVFFSRVKTWCWEIRCTNKNCKQVYVVGIVLHVQKKGMQRAKCPPDYTFPVCELQLWDGVRPVHSVTDDDSCPDIPDDSDNDIS